MQPIKITIGVIITSSHFYCHPSRDRGRASAQYRLMVAQSREDYEAEVKIIERSPKAKMRRVWARIRPSTFQRLLKRCYVVFYDRICTASNGSRVVVDDYMGRTLPSPTSSIRDADTLPSGDTDHGDRQRRYNVPRRSAQARYAARRPLIRNCDNRVTQRPHPRHLATLERFLRQTSDDLPSASFILQTHGLPCAGGYLHLRIHQRRACRGLQTDAVTVSSAGLEVAKAANILIDQVEVPKDRWRKQLVRTRLIVRGQQVSPQPFEGRECLKPSAEGPSSPIIA